MVSHELASVAPYTSTHNEFDPIKRDMVKEAAGRFIGPMHPEEFLRRYVPTPPPDKDGKERVRPPGPYWEGLSDAKVESDMYLPYVHIFLHSPLRRVTS